MKRIYVAGPYSAGNVLDVLRNIGRGEAVCAELFERGYAPFCPWHDKQYVTSNPNGAYTVEQFYEYSLAWLEVSDAVLLVGDWTTSKGTLAEVARAKEIGIPVFESLSELERFEFKTSIQTFAHVARPSSENTFPPIDVYTENCHPYPEDHPYSEE